MLRCNTVPNDLDSKPLEWTIEATSAFLGGFLKLWLDLLVRPGESLCPSDDPSWQTLEIPNDENDGLYKLLNFRLDELAASKIIEELRDPSEVTRNPVKSVRFPIERMDVFRIIFMRLIREKVLDVETLDARNLDVETLDTELLETEDEDGGTKALDLYSKNLNEFFTKLDKTLIRELRRIKTRSKLLTKKDIEDLFILKHPQTGETYQKVIGDAARGIIRGLPVRRTAAWTPVPSSYMAVFRRERIYKKNASRPAEELRQYSKRY